MNWLSSLVLAALLTISFSVFGESVRTGFTYQGELRQLGEPANGSYDFQFNLFDVEADGAALTSPVQLEDVNVQDGAFTVELDFGTSAFNGTQLWLGIGVRVGASIEPFITLSPRQLLTVTPFAIQALSVTPGSITGTSIAEGSITPDKLAPACSSGDILVMGETNWECLGGQICISEPEICDGLDNDCNGRIDDDLVPVLCPLQVGICSGSETPCRGEAGYNFDCGAVEYGPDYEATELSCDGKDNDCDGLVDAGLTNACGGCAILSNEPGAPCGTCGVWECLGLDDLVCNDPCGEGAS